MSDLKKTVDIVFSGKDNLSGTLSRMKAGFSGFASGVTKMAKGVAVFGAALTAAGIAGAVFVKKGLETADGIAKTADAIGITTDKLQEYQFIAGRSGVATESMNSGFKTFAKRLGELKLDTGALNSFLVKYDENLANALKSTNSTGEALDVFMRHMAGVTSQSEKASLAAAGFSKSVGVVMTNMTKGGISALEDLQAAYERLGLGIDEELLRNSEAAVDAMGDLSSVIQNELLGVAVRLAPEMEALAKFFVENREGVSELTDAIVEFVKVDLAGWVKGVDWSGFSEDIKTVIGFTKDLSAALLGITSASISAGKSIASGDIGKSIQDGPLLSKIPGSSLAGYFLSGDFGMDIETVANGLGELGSEVRANWGNIPFVKMGKDIEGVAQKVDELSGDFTITPLFDTTDLDFETIDILSEDRDVVFTPSLEWDEDGLKPLELIPTEKIIEIQLQGDIDTQLATIEAHAQTVQAAMEWEAKVSIANAEADAQRVASAFTATASAIDSTASSMSGLLDAMSGDFSQRWEAEKALDQQLEIQKEQADLQARMLEEQIKYMELKNEKVASGESLITIDSSGLEPALEMVMWQILEKVQIRAAENLDDYLLGIPA